MIVLDGDTTVQLQRSRGPAVRRLARQVGLRLLLCLALVASALGGAILATGLRPAAHAVAVHPHLPRVIPAKPKPIVIPTPAAPARAVLIVDAGHATANGAWIDSRAVSLRVTLTGARQAGTVRVEAEVAPADVAFTGIPTLTSNALRLSAGARIRTALTVSQLADGQRYHWRVRTRALDGKVSPWSGGGMFGVSVSDPLPPQLAASNLPIGGWSTETRPLFRWTDAGSNAPIAYFEYLIGPEGSTSLATNTSWQRAHGAVLALPRWPEGRWRLQVRAVDLAGNSSRPAIWLFGLARHAPPAPRIVSATPAQGAWSNVGTPSARWTETAAPAPLRGYQYSLSLAGDTGSSPAWTAISTPALTLPTLSDGDWLVRIRAVDVTGAYSASVPWTFHLDRAHPLLTSIRIVSDSFNPNTFTPPVEKLQVRFGLGTAAAIGFRVYAAGAKTPILTHTMGARQPGPVRLMWDGRLPNKHLAPAGVYSVVVDAVDRAGNQSEFRTAPVTLLRKRIVVSVSKDMLWAYQGDTLFLKSPVTNGGPDTPTLPGIFHVQGKYRGWVMHSPWPKGSPLWYPDSPTNFALVYNPAGGYFLHDAPWRFNYGPGSNSVAGAPGGSYTGTHGCTNVPYPAMATLFDWADDGTVIQIIK